MHIVLYVLDALRADHLSCYGYEREVSPCVDALACEGVLFEDCFTSTTWTRPVAASILSGAYPGVHLTRSRHDAFFSNLPLLPGVLKAAGFKSAAFSTMGNVGSELGFGRGFDTYYDLFCNPAILSKRRKLDRAKEGLMHSTDEDIALPRAEDVHDYFFPWLEENRSANTFSFIWSMETHVPYAAPNGFRRFSTLEPSRPNEGERDDLRSAGLVDRQRLMNLYDDEIYYNDYCIGQIISHLKKLDIYDDAFIVVVADHGDAFYEHGVYAHGHAPYEELIHVPMVMKFPGGQYAGRRVEGLIELIDIFPTVVAVTGLAPDTGSGDFVQGHNLLPLIEGTQSQVREYVFSDTQSLDVGHRYLSVRGQRWKYIQVQRPKRDKNTLISSMQHIIDRRMIFDILRHPRYFLHRYFVNSSEYLFDLEADPGEQLNLAAEYPDRVGRFRQLLVGWQQRNDELAQQVGSLSYTYEEGEGLRRHLEELGYM